MFVSLVLTLSNIDRVNSDWAVDDKTLLNILLFDWMMERVKAWVKAWMKVKGKRVRVQLDGVLKLHFVVLSSPTDNLKTFKETDKTRFKNHV